MSGLKNNSKGIDELGMGPLAARERVDL